MRKALALAVVLAFVIGVAAPAYAGVDKIGEGLKDVLKSPLVLIEHLKESYDDADNKIVGLVKGLIEAPFHFVDKAGHGILKVVTFPID